MSTPAPRRRQDEALAAHPRELVLELGEVHLQRALERVRVLAEHREDELGAVEHVGVDGVEHGRHLRRRQVVLADGDRGRRLRIVALRSAILPLPR